MMNRSTTNIRHLSPSPSKAIDSSLGFRHSDLIRISDFGFRISPTLRRGGFSFIEVMFAVIILGIGFVMVSAMFPVAIQQTQMNVEDAAVGRVEQLAQANFTTLKQDLISQTNSNTGGKLDDLYYGWPMTLAALTTPPVGQTAYNGKIFSFRDSRWPAMTVPPPLVSPPQFPTPGTGFPLGSKYQFPLYSVPIGLSKVTGLWDRIRGNMISSAEPQYAYVPMFQRGLSYNPTAQTWTPNSQVNLYVFVAAARNRTPYSYRVLPAPLNSGPSPYGILSDVFRNPPSDTTDTLSTVPTLAPATLEPRLVTVEIVPRSGSQIVDQIVIQKSNFGQADAWLAAGTGAYVIISDDTNGVTAPPWPAWGPGSYNGQIYRLGAPTTLLPPAVAPLNSSTWELQPGSDVSNPAAFIASGASGVPMQAFILGRAFHNPDAAYDATTNPYDGPVQDLGFTQFTISIPQ